MYNIIFSMDNPLLSDEQREAIKTYPVQWTVVHDTGTRLHVDVVLDDPELMGLFMDLLADRNPVIHGMWDYETGEQIMPFDAAGFLSVCPDVAQWVEIGVTGDGKTILSQYDDNGDALLMGPPTKPIEIHRPSGMAWRDMS